MTNNSALCERPVDQAALPSVAVSCAILLGVMGLGLSATVAVLSRMHGQSGMEAGLIGGGLCVIGALCAFLLAVPFAATSHAGSAALAGMLFRLGLPLFGLMALPNLFPQLVEHGLVSAVLANYFVGLVTETLLAVRHVAAGQRKLSAGRTAASSSSGSSIINVTG